MADDKRDNLRWLIATGVFAVVLCALALILRNCHTHGPPTAQHKATRSNPTPADFVGTWRGRWDGQWNVQFTITRDTANSPELNVLYEWEENVGQPMNQRNFPVNLQGDALVAGMIEIRLSASDPRRATATGRFRNTRTAALVRDP